MNRHEWDGGCEDPRVVESPSGEYVMTYTSYGEQLGRRGEERGVAGLID
jgi:predicted GH43/DUF377 family glycosyl hydrolase